MMADDPLLRNPLLDAADPAGALYRERAAKPVKRDVKLATFSFYPEDLAHLESLVSGLKNLGRRGVNKSRVIRQALAAFDPASYRDPK
jgi:hypothetical protein